MDFSPEAKARIAQRKTLRRKQVKAGEKVKKNALAQRMAEIQKNHDIEENCPFKRNLYYNISDNEHFIGNYKFIGIDFRSERYMWSTTDHVSHDIKFSPMTVRGIEISFDKFNEYWHRLDNTSSLSEV